MSEILENIETPIEEEIVELPQRVNPFCVISKAVYEVEDINGIKHNFHLIETNSGWSENPYGDGYAVVPDDMVQAILETRGFCDIELSEDGTEVVGFTAREIPTIEPPKETAEPTVDDIINAMLGLEG